MTKLLAVAVNIVPNAYANVSNLLPSDYVSAGITLLIGVSGVAAFIYLLWGGLQWITAGGDKEGIEKARRRIMHALIGLSLVFSAYAILFVIRVLFNVNLIGFTLQPITNY